MKIVRKKEVNVYDYISLKRMRNISTLDISPNQKPFLKVHEWREGEPVPIDMEDYDRVTSLLQSVMASNTTNLYNSLFLLYTLYAEPAQAYIGVMENMDKISRHNAELSRCIGALKVCERVDISICGGQVIGIQIFARKRNERVPEICLDLAKYDLYKSELKWVTKIKDADVRFSDGEDFEQVKGWLTKTLNRPNAIKGTTDKNNFQPKFFQKLTALYHYLIDAGVFANDKCLPTAATIDFIVKLLKLPDDPITRAKFNSYIGRKPTGIAF